jgi:thiosulfate dehydrogenase [quinone] large subunit
MARLEPAFRRAREVSLPGWVFAPLRLFLAVTFIYAGIQKLTDPQFFNPHAIGFIGNQIQGFAKGAPIHGLLIAVALPHAAFWGGVIAWGEIAIGLGTLVGFLLRPAAFFGLLLSLMFFLSASWHVHPYFYGADIVFVFAWAALFLAGPMAGGWPALDLWLAPWIEGRVAPERREQARAALAFALGTSAVVESSAPREVETEVAAQAPATTRVRASARAVQRARFAQAEVGRRQFVRGALVGGGVMLVASWLWGITHPAVSPASTGATTGGTGNTGAGASATSGASNEIALVKDVPVNSAATFTIPSSQDPGVLVHLESGKFVAFDAVCTHAGCPVQYDPNSKMLYCPCHGAAFDPAHGAEVIQGPAPVPLTSVSVNVDQATGAITLN